MSVRDKICANTFTIEITMNDHSQNPSGSSNKININFIDTITDAIDTEEKYHKIFRNTVEGIFLTTPSGTYLDVNPALAAIYGFSSPEELIQYFKDIRQQLYVDPERRDEFTRILKRDAKVVNLNPGCARKTGRLSGSPKTPGPFTTKMAR